MEKSRSDPCSHSFSSEDSLPSRSSEATQPAAAVSSVVKEETADRLAGEEGVTPSSEPSADGDVSDRRRGGGG